MACARSGIDWRLQEHHTARVLVEKKMSGREYHTGLKPVSAVVLLACLGCNVVNATAAVPADFGKIMINEMEFF